MYDQVGVVNFIDVTVDRTTDTVIARATIPNPKGVLIDGQLVRVLLESGEPKEEVVIPQSALIADQQGVYVFVVEDGKAAVKRLKLGGETGTDVVVEDGLSAGAQVIVEGLQNVRPGIAVRASPLPPKRISRTVIDVVRNLRRPAAVRDRHRDSHHHRRPSALFAIPFAQYPDIVPPQVSVSTRLPGRPPRSWRKRSPSRSRRRSSASTR